MKYEELKNYILSYEKGIRNLDTKGSKGDDLIIHGALVTLEGILLKIRELDRK